MTAMKAYLTLLASVLLLGSCTLEMEDYTMPEEERGKYELYTIENEYGTISYKFKDSVLYVTDNIREQFLVRVEDDSILYISESIPDDWKPYVGQKLAANISHQLPWGLNHRVIDVQNVGGIYKVTTTPVSTDDVYEDLKICLDADLASPDIDSMTEEEIADFGYERLIDPETGDTVYMDWNDYDIAHGLRPAAARRSSLTRALSGQTRGDEEENEKEKEEIEEGKVDENGVAKTVFCDQFWDTRDLTGLREGASGMYKAWNYMFTELEKAAKKAGDGGKNIMGWDPYFGLGLEIVDYEKVHIEEDKERKYEFKYTDTWSEWNWRAECGLSLQPNFDKDKQREGYGDPAEMLRRMKEIQLDDGGRQLVKNKVKCKTTKSWDRAKIRFPIGYAGPLPVAAIIGATLSPVIEVNGSLAVRGTYRSDKVRTYHKVENGEVKDWNDTLEKGQLTKVGATGQASIKFGASVRAYAGIEVGVTAGVTIGANLETYVEGEFNIDIVEANVEHNYVKPEERLQYANCKAALRFRCGFYWDIQLFVAPLGVELWSHDLYKSDSKWFIWKEIASGPNLGSAVHSYAEFGNLENIYEFASNDDTGFISAYYYTTDLAVDDSFMEMHDYRPGMKLYFGPIADNKWIYMPPAKDEGGPLEDMGKWGIVKGNTTYRFLWFGDLEEVAKELNIHGKISEVHMVPIFYYYFPGYNPSGHTPEEAFQHVSPLEQMVFNDYEGWQYVADPYIYTVASGQLSSQDLGMKEKGTLLGEGGDTSWDQAKHVWRYSFYTTVNVMGGSRMSEWGLDIKIYDPYKKRIKNSHKTIKAVNKLRTGTYTFVISFDSDWNPNATLYDKNDPTKEIPNQLYYTAKPYWISVSDPEAQASGVYRYADDKKSEAKYPIESDFNNPSLEFEIFNNKTLFGELQEETLYEAL